MKSQIKRNKKEQNLLVYPVIKIKADRDFLPYITSLTSPVLFYFCTYEEKKKTYRTSCGVVLLLIKMNCN